MSAHTPARRNRQSEGGEPVSLPRPGHDYCPSCYGGPGGHYEECRCLKHCRECGGMTNHTTQQHQDAERIMCRECGDVEVKDEGMRCGECLSEMASYYEPDEGGSQ